jgi:hypothetical protein
MRGFQGEAVHSLQRAISGALALLANIVMA